MKKSTPIPRWFSITFLVITTLAAAAALAIWTLPNNPRWQDWVGNFATEFIRAAILIINVQILAQSEKAYKYYLVIFLSSIAALGIGVSIYQDFVSPVFPYERMSLAHLWKVQVLSFLISAGELSLSFLLSPDGTRYEELMQERNTIEQERNDWREYGQTMMTHAQAICKATGQDYNEDWALERQSKVLAKSSAKVAESSELIAKLSDVVEHNKQLVANNKVSINNVRPIVCTECGKIHDAKTNMRKEIECTCGNVASVQAQVVDIKKKVG